MTVGLAMIVRDEEATLPRLLNSLPAEVDPSLSLIIDTGSCDKTRKVALDWGATLMEQEWKNFAHNRSYLMQMARGRADHLMLLDADMELDWHTPNLEPLVAQVAKARIEQSGFTYTLPVFVDGSLDWRYEGYAHAALAGPEQCTLQDIRSFSIIDHSTFDRTKIVRDIDALWQELRDTGFANPRAWFYLGQSYRDLGEKQMAAACFSLRATTGGMEEERWNALYMSGLLVAEDNIGAGLGLLVQAFMQRPFRAEPLRAIAALADSLADTLPFPEDEVLPVRREMYGPRA